MEENIYNIKKYPKSVHNRQCIGPCYKKDTKIIHPLYFDLVTNLDSSFCPVVEWEHDNILKIQDNCYEINQNESTSYNTMDLLFPYVDFNTQLFLNLFYKIISYNNGIEWLNNNLHLNINKNINFVKINY